MPYKDAMIRQMEEKLQEAKIENDLLKLFADKVSAAQLGKSGDTVEALRELSASLAEQKLNTVAANPAESLMDMLNQAAQDAMDITKAQEEDQSSAEMRDSNGDELWPEDDFGTTESEDFDDAISTDDRIYQAFEQITNRSIDNLNETHTDEDVKLFMTVALAREQWLQSYDGD